MIASTVTAAENIACDFIVFSVRIFILLVGCIPLFILCRDSFLRLDSSFMGCIAAGTAGSQLSCAARLVDRQFDRIRVNHRRFFRLHIGLRNDAAVFGAAHALRGIFDSQIRRVLVQIGPASAVRSALSAIGNALCSSGRGCRNGKYSIGTGANARTLRLLRNFRHIAVRQRSDRQRIGIIRGSSVCADRFEHILILRARLYFGIGQRVFAVLIGCQTAHRAQQGILRAAGVVRHIAVNLDTALPC